MTDLVVISLEVWDDVWRRNQHLVSGLLKRGHIQRVLFVEPPVDVPYDVLGRRRPARSGLRRIEIHGVAGDSWAIRPRKWLPRKVSPRGDRLRAAQVKRVARRLGMTDPVLWVNDPGGAEVLSATGWPSLYDITDDWLLAERSQAELARLRRHEEQLLTSCHAVVVCSEALRRTKSRSRKVILIPNAVDIEPYRVLQERPQDLPTNPVALYLGTAHRDRLDVDVCIETARHLAALGRTNPQPSLVLVGPAPLPASDLARLREAGVSVLGPRRSDQVPGYLQHADILLVPHVLTDFTASLDPIKAYEYRAARRPVVSTPVPGFADTTDPLVTSVPAIDFPAVVAARVANPVRWSAGLPDDIPTWNFRVDQMADVIARIERKR